MHSSIIIGTGFSGIAMAIKLKEKGIHDFIILEKAEDVGGTWRENTYPGAECDIPSALYSYSFEPYPDWEYKWSMQPQILEYIHYVVDKYDIRPHIHFQKELTSAEWDEEGHWNIKTKDGSSYVSKTFISAIGQLHHPSTPNFKGKESFENANFHSALWDHSVSLKDKVVGVIGNAASAVQFIPEIAKEASKVIIFQRSANWMLPKQDRMYKDWEKSLVRKFPMLLKAYRVRLWLLGGGLFFMMKRGNNLLRKAYERQTKSFIKKHIKDEKLVEKLIPKYPLGAKRVLFSDTYYPALARPNVEVITDSIKEIKKQSVEVESGETKNVDVLVYATGFKTNPFLLGLDIKGKNGTTIKESWSEGPKNYLGITVEGFPNMFLMYGPNTNLGHNSIIIMSEAQANYISQCVLEIESKNLKSIEVKSDVINKYHDETQERLQNMIWASIDDSWYKSENGNIPNNYPGRTMEYMRKTQKVDFGDFEVV